MADERTPRVVLLSSRESLRGLGAALRAHGGDLLRVEAIRAVPCEPRRGRGRVRRSHRPDAVVVASRHAAGPVLLSWVPPRPVGPELWAVGPGTAVALRRLGYRRVVQGRRLGLDGVLEALGPEPRSVLHLRSDIAGSGTARALRSRGHRVVERVAYRVRPRLPPIRRHAASLRRAGALVVTSPSVLAALRRAVDRTTLRSIGRRVPAVVLGDRTRRAAVASGFRRVVVAPETTPQRFARLLLRVAIDARS